MVRHDALDHESASRTDAAAAAAAAAVEVDAPTADTNVNAPDAGEAGVPERNCSGTGAGGEVGERARGAVGREVGERASGAALGDVADAGR